MKVKMTVSQYGPGVARNAGDEVDLNDDEAKALIQKGLATPVRSAAKETTSKKTRGVEKATK